VVVVRAGAGAVSGGTTGADSGAVAGPPAGDAAPLWRRLFDDAAIFPPGNAAFVTAVPAYAARRGTGLAGYVGPFIAPAGRWAEFRDALPGDVPPGGAPAGGRLEVSVTLPADRQALATLLDAVAAEPRVALRSVEVAPAGTVAGLADTLAALGELLPVGVTGYLEVPVGAGFAAAAAAVASAGLRIKVRTGGTTAGAFPGVEDLAGALATCVRLPLPFKLTAGLHNALRHRDRQTGFEHHGFLNVLAALDAALAAGPGSAEPDPATLARIAEVLADTDPARVAGRVAAMPADRVRHVRELFTSFGTCSIDEPFGDLVSLGLIGKEAGA
jgi:hypothetical protein